MRTQVGVAAPEVTRAVLIIVRERLLGDV